MNCPGCGAPLRSDNDTVTLVCDYCGSVHHPAPNVDGVSVLGASDLRCPVCPGHQLSLATLGDERIHYCEHCHGLLASMDTFVPMTARLRSSRGSYVLDPPPLDLRDLDRSIRCPQCGHAMEAHVYGGPGNLVIDSCESCEWNWLDGGEVARIVVAPDYSYEAAR